MCENENKWVLHACTHINLTDGWICFLFPAQIFVMFSRQFFRDSNTDRYERVVHTTQHSFIQLLPSIHNKFLRSISPFSLNHLFAEVKRLFRIFANCLCGLNPFLEWTSESFGQIKGRRVYVEWMHRESRTMCKLWFTSKTQKGTLIAPEANGLIDWWSILKCALDSINTDYDLWSIKTHTHFRNVIEFEVIYSDSQVPKTNERDAQFQLKLANEKRDFVHSANEGIIKNGLQMISSHRKIMCKMRF